MNLRVACRELFRSESSRTGRTVSLTIQALILVSVVSFSLETIPELSDGTRQVLRDIEVGTVAVFTVEYILRTWSEERPLRYVLSFFGIIDLLAILPFYLTTGLDLRSLRALRFIRVLRVFKLWRYTSALARLRAAFTSIRDELVVYFALTILILYLSAVGIYYLENPVQPDRFSSVPQSLWWALSTLTTVGYGDVYPVTALGKLFTFVILMLGLGIVAVPSGLLASALTQAKSQPDQPDQHE